MVIRDSFIEENAEFELKGSCRVGSVFWADDLLRYQIGSLQGKYFGSNWLDRIILAREAQKWLRYYGYDWHVARLNNWINRCLKDHGHELKEKQPKADSLSKGGEREGSLNFSFNNRELSP